MNSSRAQIKVRDWNWPKFVSKKNGRSTLFHAAVDAGIWTLNFQTKAIGFDSNGIRSLLLFVQSVNTKGSGIMSQVLTVFTCWLVGLQLLGPDRSWSVRMIRMHSVLTERNGHKREMDGAS